MRAALLRKRPGHKVVGGVSGEKLERENGRNERLDSPASALQASAYQRREARMPHLGDNWIHSQNNGVVATHTSRSPCQPLEATATHHRLTYKGTCHPTAQGPTRLRLRVIKGLGHSTAFLNGFKAGRVLGDHVTQGFPSPNVHQFQLGGMRKLSPLSPSSKPESPLIDPE